MNVIEEKRNGLKSTFVLKCSMCGLLKNIESEDESIMNVNFAVTLETVATGCGFEN